MINFISQAMLGRTSEGSPKSPEPKISPMIKRVDAIGNRAIDEADSDWVDVQFDAAALAKAPVENYFAGEGSAKATPKADSEDDSFTLVEGDLTKSIREDHFANPVKTSGLGQRIATPILRGAAAAAKATLGSRYDTVSYAVGGAVKQTLKDEFGVTIGSAPKPSIELAPHNPTFMEKTQNQLSQAFETAKMAAAPVAWAAGYASAPVATAAGFFLANTSDQTDDAVVAASAATLAKSPALGVRVYGVGKTAAGGWNVAKRVLPTRVTNVAETIGRSAKMTAKVGVIAPFKIARDTYRFAKEKQSYEFVDADRNTPTEHYTRTWAQTVRYDYRKSIEAGQEMAANGAKLVAVGASAAILPLPAVLIGAVLLKNPQRAAGHVSNLVGASAGHVANYLGLGTVKSYFFGLGIENACPTLCRWAFSPFTQSRATSVGA